MQQRVSVVRPKKNRIRDLLRALSPGVYEQAISWIAFAKDRRYRLLQKDLFERLQGAAATPFHVEIETLNRCNGTCSFCPVSRLVDPRPLQRMEEGLFRRIIGELAELNYDRVLNVFSNNEPFLDPRIFQFAEHARAQLPRAFIQLTSNGAALNPDKVERILPFLSRLTINNYDAELKLNERVGAIVEHLNANRPELASRLVVNLRRLDELKTNRAGNAPNRARHPRVYKSGCAYPFFQMVVRPDGKTSLCCNDAWGEVTLGDLTRTSLADAWQSESRRQLQKPMIAGRGKIPLCARCDNLSWSKPKRIREAIRSGVFSA